MLRRVLTSRRVSLVVIALAMFACLARAAHAAPACECQVEQALSMPGAEPDPALLLQCCVHVNVVGQLGQLARQRPGEVGLRAVAALGYLSRFSLHFAAARELRSIVEGSDDALRLAALEWLIAGLGPRSPDTNPERYARSTNPAVRAALITLIERDCEPAERTVLQHGLEHESDPTLRARWEGALAHLASCPPSAAEQERKALLSVLHGDPISPLLCDPARFSAGDELVVAGVPAEQGGPRPERRRTPAESVALLPEIERLLIHLSDVGLRCSRSRCVHVGRVNGFDFAFWFQPAADTGRPCLSRLMRNHHDRALHPL